MQDEEAALLLNGPDRYGSVSRAVHWITALLFFAMLAVGLWMEEALEESGALGERLFLLHQSTGLLVFGLTLVRLLWLSFTPPPPLPATLRPWERRLARIVRRLMYALLLAVPFSGYLNLAFDGQGTSFYGLFLIPPLVPENHDLHEVFEEVHESLVWALLSLVLLHVAGAVKHRLEPGADVLRRML